MLSGQENRPIDYMRSAGARFSPVAVAVATGLVVARGPFGSTSSLIALGLFLAATFLAWWNWRTPVATIDGSTLTWRSVPQRRATVLDLNSVRSFRHDGSRNRVEFELADGEKLALPHGWMSASDARLLVQKLSELVPHTGDS